MFRKIYIEITNICNLKCVFCPETKRKKEYMSLEKFEEIILDFDNIEWMGQGFAHQIFVLYRENNPQLTITPINMNEDVTKMYNHVINTN